MLRGSVGVDEEAGKWSEENAVDLLCQSGEGMRRGRGSIKGTYNGEGMVISCALGGVGAVSWQKALLRFRNLPTLF